MTYRIVWILIIILLITGLIFPPLMDNDAAEYASIALRMHRDQDYVHIINRDHDYLDKPHLLFWTAALGFKLTGVNHVGYRLVSVLVCLFGAFATYRLGRVLYNEQIGKLAAIIFITSQAIILSNHDVRTDSLLTGLVIVSIWTILEYIQSRSVYWLIAGSAALALAVGTKGMIAVVVTGIVILCYAIFAKKMRSLLSPPLVVGLLAFGVALSPFLICYYVQFDLHPEKFVNGQYQISGVRFLLWDQSFERFAGDRNFKNNPDFFFFFHTFLWAFLPWTFLAIAAFINRIRRIRSRGISELFRREQLTFIGCFTVFLILSASSFKLPHYINILFPLISISTAAYLFQLKRSIPIVKRLITLQLVVVVLVLVAGIVLNLWAFPVRNVFVVIVSLAMVEFFLRGWRPDVKKNPLELVWVPSAVVIVVVNFLLSANFYPALNRYQGGSNMAAAVRKKNLPHDRIYIFSDRYRSFDFYSTHIHERLDAAGLRYKKNKGESFYLVVSDRDRSSLKEQGVDFRDVVSVTDYRITRLKGNFLNPSTRESVCPEAYIIEVLSL